MFVNNSVDGGSFPWVRVVLQKSSVQSAFRLRADAGVAGLDEIFREQLEKLKTLKIATESRLEQIRSELEENESAKAQRKVIESNLNEYRQARGGANQRLLKRIMRKVIESIRVEPSRVAVRYWTSNEKRDEVLSGKRKGALDTKSGASRPLLHGQRRPKLLATTLQAFNERVHSLEFIKFGEPCGINSKEFQAHDFIEITLSKKYVIYPKVAELYRSGASLREVAKELGIPKSTARRILRLMGIALRPSCRGYRDRASEPKSGAIGTVPFGYYRSHGKLLVDTREAEIVRLIMKLWQEKQSYGAIAHHLNSHRLRTRRGGQWKVATVWGIVQRHKDHPID